MSKELWERNFSILESGLDLDVVTDLNLLRQHLQDKIKKKVVHNLNWGDYRTKKSNKRNRQTTS